MNVMLPAADDNGARLAAILPTGLAAMAKEVGTGPHEVFARLSEGRSARTQPSADDIAALMPLVPSIRSFVLIVVDGLGEANLKARAGHARTLAALQRRRISTVMPSTTSAALTTLVTGALPGEHGLIGYRIKHPDLGIISPLKDWEGVNDPAAWQRSDPIFTHASHLGFRSIAVGRPAHARGGLTASILQDAEYVGGQRIEDRFAVAHAELLSGEPTLAYVYIDELDKAGHEHGWSSDAWLRRLEQFDAALDEFLQELPDRVGVVVTADHGMVDIAQTQQILLDASPWFDDRIAEIGGEPRLRSLYLNDPEYAATLARDVQEAEGDRAWVGTRDEAIDAGWFGPTAPAVADRLGHVLIAARKQVAYVCADDAPAARAMVGQHGSLSAEERGVPLALAGALGGSGFASAVSRVAAIR